MKKIFIFLTIISLVLISCGRKDLNYKNMDTNEAKLPSIEDRIKAYAPTKISADMSHLTDREKMVVKLLAEAGHLADEIYWKQTAPDAIQVRDSLKKLNDAQSQSLLKYVNINYGPYDRIYDDLRFVGIGPKNQPKVANFYPQDLKKDEFEAYIKANPNEKAQLESQYTVIHRDGQKLKAIPFHSEYSEVELLAKKLEEAATFCDNPSLKNYLTLRAKALRNDDYFESDMAWMDLKDNNIDVVIGPIENYEDALFNYKTSFECVIMVKDFEASKELDMYEQNIDFFEHNLPYDKKYIRESAGKGNVLQIVNVAYFGGDCQKGTKTIAASLPNDPKVHELKGGKKSMYKNMMEAKFDKIVVPLAEKILDPDILKFIDKKAFTSFVTLHEVSHTLGRSYVFGKDNLDVRKALQDRFSAIEEAKADILGIYNHKHLLDKKLITPDYIKKSMVTYLAGLYRSIRFGAEEAHGKANAIQLNFLRETGAIKKLPSGKMTIDEKIFFDKVAELAKLILTIEAEGDLAAADNLLKKYGAMDEETKAIINGLSDIPRDLDTSYDY